MSNILIHNCLIVPMTNVAERCFHGSIGVSEGKIAFAGPAAGDVEQFRRRYGNSIVEIDGRGKLAMPGLVNTHNHIAMTLLRGYADDLPLMRWLEEYIWPFEARMHRSDIIAGARLGMAEMLLGGVTTTADMYWIEEAAGQAAEEAGIRIVLSPTLLDSRIEDFDTDFGILYERYGRGQHPRITMTVSPHSVYTCSPETLRYAGRVCEKYGLGLSIHVSETQAEQDIVRKRYGKTPIEHLRDLGLLKSDTLVVHAVYVSESDIEIMSRCGVSVTHNPQSNMKLASGIAPMAKMIEAGLNVSIGTDGASSNNDLDMFEEMRSASLLQKVAGLDPCALPAYETIRMATVNGAKALGLDGRTGMLRAGLCADIILLDVEKPHMYPKTDMIANIVYCAKSSDVDTVIVDGEIVVANGKLLTMDLNAVMADAERAFRRIDATKRL